MCFPFNISIISSSIRRAHYRHSHSLSLRFQWYTLLSYRQLEVISSPHIPFWFPHSALCYFPMMDSIHSFFVWVFIPFPHCLFAKRKPSWVVMVRDKKIFVLYPYYSFFVLWCIFITFCSQINKTFFSSFHSLSNFFHSVLSNSDCLVLILSSPFLLNVIDNERRRWMS